MRILRIPITDDKGQFLQLSDIDLDTVLTNTIMHLPNARHYTFKVGKSIVRTSTNPATFELLYNELKKGNL